MTLRLLPVLAALMISGNATAAVAEMPWHFPPPDAPNFPRPMPNVRPLTNLWDDLRDLLRPKLGPVTPSDYVI